MRVVVDKKQMAVAVREMRKVVARKTNVEALARVLVEPQPDESRVVLHVTDVDNALAASVPAEVHTAPGDGLVAISFDHLERAMRAKTRGGLVSLSTVSGDDATEAEIMVGRSKLITGAVQVAPLSPEITEALTKPGPAAGEDEEPAEIAVWRRGLPAALLHLGAAPGLPTGTAQVLDAVTFYGPKPLLTSLVEAASEEETRYYLNGAYFDASVPGEGLTVVATDGHRLVTWPCGIVEGFSTGERDRGYIAPIGMLKALKTGAGAKAESIRFTFKDVPQVYETAYSHPHAEVLPVITVEAEYTHGGVECRRVGKTIYGKYPDWRRVMPRATDVKTSVAVPFDEFMETVDEVKSLAGVSSREHAGAKLCVSTPEGSLRLKRQGAHGDTIEGTGPAPRDVVRNGSPQKAIEIGFDLRYLAALPALLGELGSPAGKRLVMRFKEPEDPATFQVEGDRTTALLLPVRIK